MNRRSTAIIEDDGTDSDFTYALRNRIHELEKILNQRDWQAPSCLHLTLYETKILGLLVAKEFAEHGAIEFIIYGDREDWPLSFESTIRLILGRLRKKLKPYDIQIRNVYGSGIMMTREDIAKLSALYNILH
jgi:DNA-binding response OmpR family regulator